MAATSSEPEHEKVREIETELLELLYKQYPDWLLIVRPEAIGDGATAGLPAEERALHRYGTPTMEQALANLASAGLIFTDTPGMMKLAITLRPEGIREIGRRRGMATYQDLENLNRIVTEGIARVAEAIEANQKHQAELTGKLTEVEGKVISLEREFYSRVFPFFAVFVAAFALIITSAQVVVRTTASAPDQIFFQSLAMTLPVGLVIIVMIAVVWALSHWR